MKDLFRRSIEGITRNTPGGVRRTLGPVVNPILRGLLGHAEPAPGAGPYQVRPLATPAREGPRVLHVIGNFLTGGSSRLVVDLYERLGHRYVQHVVAQVVPDPPAYIGIPVTEIRERADTRPILDVVRGFKPDLMHVHYWGDVDQPWYSRAFEAAAEASVPVIQNVNTPVAPYVCDPVREYVYVSDYVRRNFGVSGARHRVIYPGSDFSKFRLPIVQARMGRRVGMVYRLEPDKLDAAGIEPMIAAARLHDGIRFLIVGGGTFFEEYRARVRRAGLESRFEFTGYVAYDALPRLYRDIAVFVAPVWKESFGQVGPFAMHMGIPVVGYAVGAIPEIVDDDSLLAPAGDAEKLGAIVAGLMRDPLRRRRIGIRNRQRAQRHYSVEAMVAEYDRLYARHLERAA